MLDHSANSNSKLSVDFRSMRAFYLHRTSVIRIGWLPLKYRREIDGLRAVAVIPVILFHADFAVFSGGYVGVDVFFVISGYLITTLILTEKLENR